MAKNNKAFISSAIHNYIKTRALLSSGCDEYEDLLKPIMGVTLWNSLNYYRTINDVRNESKVRVLLSVLLIGIGKYTEAMNIVSSVSNEVGKFLFELARALQGMINEVSIDYADKRLEDLSRLVNSILRVINWNVKDNLNVVHGNIKNLLLQLIHCQALKIVLVIS